MKKLTLEQIKSIPELLKTKRVTEIATELNVTRATIYKWIKLHEKVLNQKIPTLKRESIRDKIISLDNTSINNIQ